jgi:hypothetical protein
MDIVYFKVLSKHLIEGTDKNTKNLSQNTQPPGYKSKTGTITQYWHTGILTSNNACTHRNPSERKCNLSNTLILVRNNAYQLNKANQLNLSFMKNSFIAWAVFRYTKLITKFANMAIQNVISRLLSSELVKKYKHYHKKWTGKIDGKGQIIFIPVFKFTLK